MKPGSRYIPNPGLGVFVVSSFLMDLQVKISAPRRSASARLATQPQVQYRGADPIPEGPAYTSYEGWGYAEPSSRAYTGDTAWEQPTPTQSYESWGQASTDQWRQGSYDYTQAGVQYYDPNAGI